MDIKSLESMYNWKPEDGDYITPDEDKSSENRLIELLIKLRFTDFYKKLLSSIFRYF
ncbi:MAG: hypothetical protein HY959_02435 [Ignavibacteriae bacterium]|nr:hypothetical protein [Ignavibacteriota bacterium]